MGQTALSRFAVGWLGLLVGLTSWMFMSIIASFMRWGQMFWAEIPSEYYIFSTLSLLGIVTAISFPFVFWLVLPLWDKR